jgi:hypothetical protein
MNRSQYYNYIEEKLNIQAIRIISRGKLNILDLNIHSENLYVYLLNELYDWELENLNALNQNVESIDLIDNINKIFIQVSATKTTNKINSALSKGTISDYKGYTFKFISIAHDADNLREKTFENPHGITFNPKSDIIDKKSILNKILGLNIDKQKKVYELVKKELGREIDIIKLDSNLAVIINILSKQDLSDIDISVEINRFDIDRKMDYNELSETKMIIEDYAIHYAHVNKKYKEFDSQGVNKSFSVLQSIRKTYIQECVNTTNKADYIFLRVIKKVKEKVIRSANYIEIPIDELDLCVNILVVDSFIRCKIFKNPENYNYAPS